MIQKYIIMQTFISFVISSEVLLQNGRRRNSHPLLSFSGSISSLENHDQSQSVKSFSIESVSDEPALPSNKVSASKKVSRSTERNFVAQSEKNSNRG